MAVVIDRWRRRDRATGKLVPTARDGRGLRYLSHLRDAAGREVTKAFVLKRDAQRWLDEQTADMVRGTYVHPTAVKTTVGEWCETWLSGYASRRPRTVRQARVHIARITTTFGNRPLAAVRPSDVKSWTARLKADGLADSYVYALHNRLSQLMSDAVHDGILARTPCSRRTTPGAGKPRPYVATTEQVWALHDAVAEHLRPAILLGAFVGLRTAEAVGLRVVDVDFMRGVVRPVQQRDGEPLKSETSRTPLPIPSELALELSAAVARSGGDYVVTDGAGRQSSTWAIERAVRAARSKVEELPEGFRFHDLRHYLASLLIGSGLDVKVVQHRLRHGSAKTTLDTYGHLWPDSDESARAAVGAVLAARADCLRTGEP
ncbi:site-specific integrase [Klenkia terrae]|uniref:site-specific integrase n=1 Tax=Klenkia terrae TaxID=1052259 RepID=UPI00175408AD|nr:tyrosine-type recombinase/integrase [Klenkia terrae]SSC21808.1 site-specific integrase [Klenkia terrae]